MLKAKDIVEKYISFFEKRGHKRIQNSPLVPINDPTTLFTSSGMQPLVSYLLGEPHPLGIRLVNVQNSFRAQDIDEIGDNRHTTFFRMLGNWSLGDYFKKEQLTWFFEFLTQDLGLDSNKLYITIFDGDEKFRVHTKNDKYEPLKPDVESYSIWAELFDIQTNEEAKKKKIFYYGPEKNWWSRSGTPDKMPVGEPGGADSEVFYDFGEELKIHENSSYRNQKCHPNCDCGRFLEIGNSVFMQYKKTDEKTFEELPKRNVDFGGGLERLIGAVENQQDIFKTNLFMPIIRSIEQITHQTYHDHSKEMRIITDHLIAATFIAANGVFPSNKEQGYVLRRLIRRGLDNVSTLNGKQVESILETIFEQYKDTDPELIEKFEKVRGVILEEEQVYKRALEGGRKMIQKELKLLGKHVGDELMGITEIPAETAFKAISSFGLSPTQLKSLGYTFNQQDLSEKIKEHQSASRKGAEYKFRGGLTDHQERTIMGHTATHLLHQALRDMFGKQIHQTGSNITTERLRFDFNFDRKLTDEEIKHLETEVNKKIKENIPVHFEMIPTEKAHKMGAIGLFMDTYGDKSKIYFIGGDSKHPRDAYSIEFCGGPHVDFTGKIKGFTIVKQENIGNGQRRLYAKVGD